MAQGTFQAPRLEEIPPVCSADRGLPTTPNFADACPPQACSQRFVAMGEIMEMKVSNKKPIGFYIRATASFLKGVEAREASEGREAVEAKAPLDEIKISGLGEAINTAVAAATSAEADGIGIITKVETQYPEMPSGRGCGQIMITVKRKC
mmetsp:Transcript_4185/g.15696  ORF Transcript_4185/g.15696 Transcript_4185/m.15696 type:complete len:150 (-) Transcript_4185:110-559(-)